MLTVLVLSDDEGQIWNQIYRKVLTQASDQVLDRSYGKVKVEVDGGIFKQACVPIHWEVQNAMKELV